MVLNLGRIEPLGFDGTISGVRRTSSEICLKAWDYCRIKYKLSNDLISAIHFYFLLYWAKMGLDKSLENNIMLQLTASPWTTEASTRERWQFRALTNRKATSSNRDPSLASLYYYKVALSLYRDKWTTIIRLWWLVQWLVTHGHHIAVTIYLHVAPSTDRHSKGSVCL